MPAPVYLHHPSSLEHDTEPHPERPERIRAIERELASRDWLGWERVPSPPVDREVLRGVHPHDYVTGIQERCAAGGGQLDADTVVSEGSWLAALHAAGGAVALVDLLLDGAVPTGFSAHRPPGHHAEPERAMGFCLFNNVAVAARHAVEDRGLERVLIVDWDVHHGNGTNDIFHVDPRVLFVSIHESPLYPGTGPASDTGGGPGEGTTLNLPVTGGSGDALWCSLVEHVVVPRAREHAPQLVLISAGYDAHREDPLATCRVTEPGFATMAASLARLAAEVEAPLGVVLEGGYAVEALARSVAVTLEVIGAGEPPPAPDLPVHPALRSLV